MSKEKRTQTAAEEAANSVSHGLAVLPAFLGTLPLVLRAFLSGSAKAAVSLTAYAFSFVLLYAVSAAYHAARDPARKRFLQVLDHCSIFLLIAGTYFPMSLLAVGGTLGWFICLTNTALALLGITLNIIDLPRFSRFSLFLYALMGWLIVTALPALCRALPPLGLLLLAAGGVAYTVGIFFYRSQKPFMHFIWHLFVLAGSILQYFCVALYCI